MPIPECTQHTHATVQQVRTQLQQGLAEIQWEVHIPVSAEDNEKRIRQLKRGNLIGLFFVLPMMAYTYYLTQMSLLLITYALFLVGEYTLLFPWMYRQIRQQKVRIARIKLDFPHQRIHVTRINGQTTRHKFHQNAALPAFWLPDNDSAEYRKQRNDLQHTIAQQIGVHFE